MNICIIDNSLGTTGAFNAIIETIEPLKKEHNYLFILPINSKLDSILNEKNIQYCKIPMNEINRNFINNLLYPFRLLRSAWKVKRIMKKHNAKILQVNDIYNLNGILLKFFYKFKLITHVRRMPDSFPKSIYTIWVKLHLIFSDKILAVSEANTQIFSKKTKVVVFYDPQPNLNKTFQYNTQLSMPIRLLYLANYMHGKGQNYALEIAKTLKNTKYQFVLNFYGDTGDNINNQNFLSTLKIFIQENKLEECVKIHGPSSNIVTQISEANIMLNFSDSESLSRITMEALYFGVPIVATNVGGTNEMIVDGWNGILVAPKNIEQMYNGVIQLIESEELRATFSQNGESLLNEKFNIELLTKKMNAIYLSLSKA